MLPTATSRRRAESSSSPIARGTFSTPATWRPVPQPPISQSLLVDAQKGLLAQTRRHSFICSLLDVAHLVVAVNKMDLVNFDEGAFEDIRKQFTQFATRLETRHIHFVPISALRGDNVVKPSADMDWFRGAPLLDYLETVHVGTDRNLIDLRFPVQSGLSAPMPIFSRLRRHRRVGHSSPWCRRPQPYPRASARGSNAFPPTTAEVTEAFPPASGHG